MKYRILAIVLVCFSIQTQAAVLNVSGGISSIDDPNGYLQSGLGLSNLAPGQAFSIDWQTDNPSAGSSFPSAFGPFTMYPVSDPGQSLILNISGASGSPVGGATTNSFVGIADNATFTSVGQDIYLLEYQVGSAGGVPLWLGIFLSDSTGQRLTNENFYIENSLSGWDQTAFYIQAQNGGRQSLLLGSTQTAVSAVPLPASVWMFATALLTLRIRYRGKK